MTNTKNTRYPGARPFKDSPLERKLFFGRNAEQKELLHLILSHNIIVLFAKSGVGKSSLLNAGVFEKLYDKGYFPVSIRLNAPSDGILETIDSRIIELASRKNVEYNPGNKESLWEFLKTAELWTSDDKLLTPVLVFDQFEEIFTLGYNEDQRKDFFKQIADLGRTRRRWSQGKKGDTKQYLSESPPKVKVVLSLREEFLAQLEEISEDIPSILHNRFRLRELTEEQAISAIESPAKLDDENLSSHSFNYSEGAIKAVTKFLMKKDLKERLKIITKTWDPKWPKWLLFLFGALLLPVALLANFLGDDLGILTVLITVWLIIPAFAMTLAVRRPIAGRNTLVPIILLYAWFCTLIYVSSLSNEVLQSDNSALVSIVMVPLVLVLILVLLISAIYRKGRKEKLSTDDLPSSEEALKDKRWLWKPHFYLFGWVILSILVSKLMDFSPQVFLLNILIIFAYFVGLSVKYPVPPKKAIAPIAIAHFLNILMVILTDYTRSDIPWPLLIVYSLLTLITFVSAASLWWSYLRGWKSVKPQLLEILGKSKEKIEPFQLQLLCQNIEEKVLLKQRKMHNDKPITITKKDFGGDQGMRRILLKFYDDQLKRVNWKIRGRVRKLCERGLISQTGRRLSIAEDDIYNRFKLEKDTLDKLVEYRLLRFERRLGSRYFEISHDTLVQPILTSAKKHINREMAIKWVGYPMALALLVYGFNFYQSLINPSNQEIYERMDNTLESEWSTIKDQIFGLSSLLDRLDQRDDLKWLIMNDERANSGFGNTYGIGYDKPLYTAKLDSLRSIDKSLLKYGNLRLVDSKKEDVEDYSIVLGAGLKPQRFSLSMKPDSNTTGFHNLEIEWYFKSDYDSEFELLRKIKMDSISRESGEVTTRSFPLSETLCEGFNVLKLYELDSDNPSRRYLREIRDFNVRLNDIGHYEDRINKEPENAKYNAHLGFLYFRKRVSNEDARTYLDNAIKNDSNYALAYYWRGHVQNSAAKMWSDYLVAYYKDQRLRPALKKILSGSINRVSNGSFEFPKLPDNNYLLTSELGRESTDTIKGPSWENEDGINFDLKSFKLGQGEAKTGKQFIELSGKSNSWIRQKVLTEPDTEYVLSFAFSPRPGRVKEDNRMEISWNGVPIDTVEADGRERVNTRWKTFYKVVKATSEESYLKFRDIGDSAGHNVGTGPYLDAIFLVKRQDYGDTY
ncbi:nSTAND1 domain-containing NTPase [Poritiphilus flavus]|uniref:Novel STAND NTPase 1 domain-containing protein n=1 Tax=Poritiphilus flavus TaxID=2697053 RepID=A0A6L9EHS2_9FLAO|nr:hypothetical protein [Poritiphilus flavus]NAS14320.1 hypothetical protein [Poritiphilus flavus]